jgi:hypothetical protein
MNKKSPSPIRFLLALLLLRALVFGPFAAYGQGEIAVIPDFALKRSLLLALGKPLNSQITVADLATLQSVTLTGYEDDVQSLSGADAELSYNSSIFESARFFRLRIFEEP